MERTVQAGTVNWLNAWAAKAVPGARLMLGPVEMTGHVQRDLADRVQVLDQGRVIIAAWKRGEHGWEWHLRRTQRPLPATWPALPRPATVQAIMGHAARGLSDAGVAGRRRAA
ncbi:MAG: hypothetical protein KGQ52_13310 [Alphaproteobacteria bacterium]|nr:hypothetical protein [Alphaproteobacteria bacterium]